MPLIHLMLTWTIIRYAFNSSNAMCIPVLVHKNLRTLVILKLHHDLETIIHQPHSNNIAPLRLGLKLNIPLMLENEL